MAEAGSVEDGKRRTFFFFLSLAPAFFFFLRGDLMLDGDFGDTAVGSGSLCLGSIKVSWVI